MTNSCEPVETAYFNDLWRLTDGGRLLCGGHAEELSKGKAGAGLLVFLRMMTLRPP